jgi:hypothetical protein
MAAKKDMKDGMGKAALVARVPGHFKKENLRSPTTYANGKTATFIPL